MNQLDAISEKSVTKDDNTEIEDEENIMEYFVILKGSTNSRCGDKI